MRVLAATFAYNEGEKIRRTLARVGRLERAIYVERGSTQAAVMMRLADKSDDIAPYFAIVLVPGWGERP